jgi:hypothetical protein
VLESGNLDEFDFHTHKMKMTLELVQATSLQAALKQSRELLVEQPRDAARVQAAIQSIHLELDAIIEALKAEMQTVVASFPAEDDSQPGEGWA